MSFEIGLESLPRRAPRRSTNRASDYYGLGATGVLATLRTAATVAAPAPAPAPIDAPWQAGLPGPRDSNDKTRIAYAKRDHDLAMPPRNDSTAYTNLKNQSVGSATAVGKAWYRAALADVDRARAAAKPAPIQTPAAPTGAPPISVPPIQSSGPYIALTNKPLIPLVQQATDMGLKIQQTSDGSVVAVNSDGAIVSKPLPVPVTAVTDSTVLPPNAVQANAPPPPPSNRIPGVFSILDKLMSGGSSSSSSGGSSFIPSQGPPPESASTPAVSTADMAAAGPTFNLNGLLQNPIVLAGGAAIAYLLFSSSSGRRR